MFATNLEFFQSIHWEYVFMFIFFIGFIVESYVVYLFSKQNDKIVKEAEDLKAQYEAGIKENQELSKRNKELCQQLSDQLDSVENMVEKVRSL